MEKRELIKHAADLVRQEEELDGFLRTMGNLDPVWQVDLIGQGMALTVPEPVKRLAVEHIMKMVIERKNSLTQKIEDLETYIEPY